MSETKFTPGPWKSCKSHYGKGYRYVQLGEEDYTTTEMLPADAYLVAAAPDMYSILHQVATDIEAQGVLIEWHQAILDVLAKARGEA